MKYNYMKAQNYLFYKSIIGVDWPQDLDIILSFPLA